MSSEFFPPLIDYKEGCRLCGGSERLYQQMIIKFQHDPTFSQLQSSLLLSQRDTAFQHAHALKGLSAQLALHALSHCADQLCCLLQAQGVDSDISDAFTRLQAVYRNTLLTINSLSRNFSSIP